MKIWDKIIHNKIIAKVALASVSIVALATVMGETPADAYKGSSVIQEQNGIVLIWEWHRLGSRTAISELMTEAYYNPTPLLIVPYDPVEDRIIGQPVSLYADSDHVLANPNRRSSYPMITVANYNRTLYEAMDYSIAGELPGKTNLASYYLLKGLNSASSNVVKTAEITDWEMSVGVVDDRSLVLRSDYDNDVINYDDLHSDVFYTGGNNRGCLWFTDEMSSVSPSDYNFGGGPNLIGWLTLSEPECKTQPSAIIRQESIVQNISYRADLAKRTEMNGEGGNDQLIYARIPLNEIVDRGADRINPDFHTVFLRDSGEMTSIDNRYKTYLGLVHGNYAVEGLISSTLYFESLSPTSSGFIPMMITGHDFGNHYSSGASASTDIVIAGVNAKASGGPSGATLLAYDSGLMYGFNRFFGNYRYSVKSSASVVGINVYSDTEHYTKYYDPRSSLEAAYTKAKARGGFFTTMYGAFYGKDYIFSAFKGETDEASLDGRPTTVISGIRTVGGTTYEDENGAVIETEGEILCEGSTIVIPEGAVLAVDGNFVNNGKIEINGGTLIVKDGGMISQIGNTCEGSIVCNQGDSGESGQIIVMPGGKILCTAYINLGNVLEYTGKVANAAGNYNSAYTTQPGLIMNAGSSLVNYGTVCCSSVVIDSKATIECRKGSEMMTGYCNKDEIFFFAKAENYMDGLESISADHARKLELALNAKLSMTMATGTDEEVAAVRAAYGIMREFFKNAATIITKGEGDVIITKEPDAGNIEGFGDKVIIKTTEY